MLGYISQSSVAHALTMAANFAFAVYLGNYFSVAELAYFALINAFILSGIMFSELGVNQPLVRFMSKNITNRDNLNSLVIWSNLKKFKNFLICAPLILLYYGSVKSSFSVSYQGVVLSLILVLLTVRVQTKLSEYQALLDFKMYGIILISLKTLPILIFVTLSRFTTLITLHFLIISLVVAVILNLILMNYNLKNELCHRTNNELTKKDDVEFFRYYFRSSLIVAIITNIDIYYLGYFSDADSLAKYFAASRLILPLMSFIGVYNLVLWPMLNRMDRVQTTAIIRAQLKIGSTLAILASIYVYGASNLYELVYGETYGDIENLIFILGIRYVIGLIATPLGIIAYNFGFVNISWKMNFLQLFVYVALLIGLPANASSIALALLIIEVVGLFLTLLFLVAQKTREW